METDSFVGLRAWNSIPFQVKASASHDEFRAKIKRRKPKTVKHLCSTCRVPAIHNLLLLIIIFIVIINNVISDIIFNIFILAYFN